MASIDDAGNDDGDVLSTVWTLAILLALCFIASTVEHLSQFSRKCRCGGLGHASCTVISILHMPLRRSWPMSMSIRARIAYGFLLTEFACQSDPIANAAKSQRKKAQGLPVVPEEMYEELAAMQADQQRQTPSPLSCGQIELCREPIACRCSRESCGRAFPPRWHGRWCPAQPHRRAMSMQCL